MTALERFNEMREQGSEVYFDTDEIIELLEYFDEKVQMQIIPTGKVCGCN